MRSVRNQLCLFLRCLLPAWPAPRPPPACPAASSVRLLPRSVGRGPSARPYAGSSATQISFLPPTSPSAVTLSFASLRSSVSVGLCAPVSGRGFPLRPQLAHPRRAPAPCEASRAAGTRVRRTPHRSVPAWDRPGRGRAYVLPPALGVVLGAFVVSLSWLVSGLIHLSSEMSADDLGD